MSLPVYYDLTFADVVQKFGPPSRISYLPTMFGPISCQIQLHWPDKMLSVMGYLLKACPESDKSGETPRPNPNIRVATVYYGSYKSLDEHSQPWSGLVEGPFIFLDLVPGGLFMWFVFLESFIVLMALAFLKRNWPSGVVSIPLAGIATFLPTLHFQFSDVCIPTIIAYGINTLICSFAYIAIAEGVRFAWRRTHQTTAS